MDRRTLLAAGLAASAAGVARAQTAASDQTAPTRPDYDRYDPPAPRSVDPDAAYDPSRDDASRRGASPPRADRRYGDGPATPSRRPDYPVDAPADTYSHDEIVSSVSDFLGVTAEAAGAAVERVFRERGRPTGYIAGEEIAAAFFGGLRYGKGLLYMKRRDTARVFWQGPSVGWDFGANGSRCFTLCYNLQYPDAIYRRFPGVEGSAYFIGGLGVNYQRADEITLAPMRAGVGLRLGANVGYLAYSRRRQWFPF